MFDEFKINIQSHAKEDYPNESCGLIIEGLGYKRCRNIHDDPENHFRMNPELLIAYEGKIKALIHSHPDGEDYPSEGDMRSQIATMVPWGICTVGENGVGDPFYFGDGIEKEPLIGRGFRHGVTDCYSMIRDYYLEIFNEKIIDIPRNWKWWESGLDLYTDFLESAGFEKIEVGNNPQKGDICFFAIKSDVPNHAGIYLGDENVLHHPCRHGLDLTCLSRREPIARRLKHVAFWARYSEFIK